MLHPKGEWFYRDYPKPDPAIRTERHAQYAERMTDETWAHWPMAGKALQNYGVVQPAGCERLAVGAQRDSPHEAGVTHGRVTTRQMRRDIPQAHGVVPAA